MNAFGELIVRMGCLILSAFLCADILWLYKSPEVLKDIGIPYALTTTRMVFYGLLSLMAVWQLGFALFGWRRLRGLALGVGVILFFAGIFYATAPLVIIVQKVDNAPPPMNESSGLQTQEGNAR